MFDFDTQADAILLDGTAYEITDVTYTLDCYADGNVVGTAVAKKLEFTSDADIDFETKEFEYIASLWVGGVRTDVNLGTFIVIDAAANTTTGLTTVTAADTMIRFNIAYESGLDYAGGTVTIQDVLEECCIDCNVPLAAGQTLANANFVVDSNQFTDGQLYRDVIIAIAQISGTYAQIVNDELVFTLRGAGTATEIPPTVYATLDAKRTTQPINTVVLRNSQVEGENITKIKEGTPETGQNLLVIEDNPFAYSQDKREALIDALFDAVVDFGYVAYEASGQADPRMICGAPVQVQTIDEETLDSYLFRMVYKSPAGVSSTVSAPSIIKATVAYQVTADALDIAKRTEIKVDKANGEITSLAQQTQALAVSTDARWAELDERVQENKTLITQTAEQIMASMSVTGGNNMLQNSVGYKDLTYWTPSDPIDYSIVQDVDTDRNTVSGSGIRLNNGSLQQTVHVLTGTPYNLSFSYQKTGLATQVSRVQLVGEASTITVLEAVGPMEEYTEISFTWTAEEPVYTLLVETDNDALTVYDLRITLGDSGQTWSQARDEIYGKGVLLDKQGIQINPLDSGDVSLYLDNDSLYIKNGSDVVSELSDERVAAPKAELQNSLKIGKVVFRALSDTRIIIAKE